MAKYVPDSKTQRWVIIAPQRIARPAEAVAMAGKPNESIAPATCPFCEGNEAMTPPEVYRIGPGEKDARGWQVRVVPNKYPITDIHEVIIHSPDCEKDIEQLPADQVIRVLTAYRDRYRAHEADGHVFIFCNHGFEAGASLKHPHSQLVVVPKQITLDAVSREPIANVVDDGNHFVTYCPDFSQWPYEVWIAPKAGEGKFGDITEEQLTDLAGVLQKALRAIRADQYNYYIYHDKPWFIRIIPRLIHRAGFELGTGLNVNIVDPGEAALQLKKRFNEMGNET